MSERVWSIVLQSSVLLASAWLVAWVLRRQGAALRHYVWTLALGFVLLLPLWPEARVVVVPIEVSLAPTRIVVTGDAVAGVAVDWMLFLWLAGVGLLLSREVLAQVRGVRLAGRAVDSGRGYALSPDLAVPAVCGLFGSRVLLPLESTGWSEDRVGAVLAHERMHLLRRDLWWQLVGRIACAVYWPNPLVWLAARAQQRECEQACDDGVVVAGMAATDYADHLVAIARNLGSEPLLEGGLSMAKASTLERRLAALLNPLTSHRPVTRGTLVLTFALSLALLGPVAGLKLIAQTSGGVKGVVVDASGGQVPEAKVTVRFPKGGRVEVVRTNDAGEFSFPELAEDFYTVTVEKEGFAALTNSNVKLGGPQGSSLRFALNLGSIREVVRVEGKAPAQDGPVAVAGAPVRIRIGGNVQAAKILSRVPPQYPPDCRAEGVQGIVVLTAVIGKAGEVLSLEPMNQFVDSRLRDAAVSAVKLWRYQPTLLNGNPVEVTTQVDVNFTLTK